MSYIYKKIELTEKESEAMKRKGTGKHTIKKKKTYWLWSEVEKQGENTE